MKRRMYILLLGLEAGGFSAWAFDPSAPKALVVEKKTVENRGIKKSIPRKFSFFRPTGKKHYGFIEKREARARRKIQQGLKESNAIYKAKFEKNDPAIYKISPDRLALDNISVNFYNKRNKEVAFLVKNLSKVQENSRPAYLLKFLKGRFKELKGLEARLGEHRSLEQARSVFQLLKRARVENLIFKTASRGGQPIKELMAQIIRCQKGRKSLKAIEINRDPRAFYFPANFSFPKTCRPKDILPALRSFSTDLPEFDGACMNFLVQKAPNLSSLRVEFFTPEMLEVLRGLKMKALRHLSVGFCADGNQKFDPQFEPRWVHTMKSLIVDLKDNKNGEGLAARKMLEKHWCQLEALEVKGVLLNEGFEFCHMPLLKKLKVSRGELGARGVEMIFRKCKDLTDLEVSNDHENIDLMAERMFGRLPQALPERYSSIPAELTSQLESLVFTSVQMTSESFKGLIGKSVFPKVKTLNFHFNKIENLGEVSIAEQFPALQELDFSNNKLSYQTILDFLRGGARFPKLQKLDFSGNPLTPWAADALMVCAPCFPKIEEIIWPAINLTPEKKEEVCRTFPKVKIEFHSF